MFTKFSGKTLFSKIIVTVLSIGFVLTTVPVSYANTDALRAPAAKDRAAQDIGGDLAERTHPEKIDPWVLSSIISLLEGAQTGGYNIEHAVLDGANGGIFNHSEPRGRLENMMDNMILGIVHLIDTSRSSDASKETWVKTLKGLNLSDQEIANIASLFEDFYSKMVSARDGGGMYMPRGTYVPIYNINEARRKMEAAMVHSPARRLVNYIMNIQLKKVIAYSNKYPIQQTVLCVGETLSQYEAKRTQEVLREDLEQILQGITQEQAQRIGLRIAYEPRWAIGTGKTPTLDEIQSTHRFAKDTLQGILGRELEVDYGGSLNEKNSKDILALADVDGGLIGGAAKVPEKISVIIDAAVEQGQRKGKLLNVGMNWKAEDASTGLSPLDAFVELFRTKDLSRVRIAIGTPNVKLVRDTMTKLESEISAVSLYSGIVVRTENIGPFTKETLAAKTQATKAIYDELERRFGEKTRVGDVYFRLKIGNRYFALAKENSKDQTLMTAATLDLTDPQTKAEYYAALLEYAYLVANQTGKRIELIEEKGDRFKQYLSSQPSIISESISIAFKETDRPIARGWSLIVQPEITVLVRTADTTVYNNFPAGFDNVVDPLKDLKDSKGAVVVGANTIFENAGTISALRRLKEAKTDLKVAVWAQNQATVDKLKVMGVEEVADIISSRGLGDLLSELSKSGIPNERIMLIYDWLRDEQLIFSEFNGIIELLNKNPGMKAIRVVSRDAGHLNPMPLIFSRAIAAIFQNESSVVKPYQELVQNYKQSNLIYEHELEILNNLTSQLSEVPVVRVSDEIMQAQLTYEETAAEI